MLKKLFLSAIILGLSMTALSAQNQKPSWSLDVGLNSSAMYNAGAIGGYGVGASVGVVLMPIPQVGFRVDIPVGYGTSINKDPKWVVGDNYFKSAITLDVLWDIRETFCGRMNDMRYHIQPYFHFSELRGFGNLTKAYSIGLGFGLRQVYLFNDKIGILWDVNALVTCERCWRDVGGRVGMMESRVGVTFSL